MDKRMLGTLCALTATSLVMVALALPMHTTSLRGDVDNPAIDAYIEAQMKDLNIPGLALAVVQGSQIAYMRAYGRADPSGRAVTPQTPFLIGSTTKSITALAVMQLVEAGQIELDAPVQTYLPWFRVADPNASGRITVRHLLNQTSGFSTATGLKEIAASDLSEDATESIVRRLEHEVLAYPPGIAFEYSNVNYATLGLIVQAVSGQPYESYVQEHIFDPLEMRHSYTSQTEAMQGGMAAGHVSWFRIPIPRTVPFNRGYLSAGCLISSAEDLAHYLLAQINGGRFGEIRVLSPEGVAEMHRPAVPRRLLDASYGMGWNVGPTHGVPSLYHVGINPNFVTFLLIVPQEQLGIAVTMNANGTFQAGAGEQIAAGVMSALMGQQLQPYKSPSRLLQIVGSVAAPATVSVLWIAWTVHRTTRRRRTGGLPKRSAWCILWAIVAPLAVEAGLLWVLLFGIPKLWGVPMDGLVLMYPDMATLLFGSVAALAGWGLARTIWRVLLLKPRWIDRRVLVVGG